MGSKLEVFAKKNKIKYFLINFLDLNGVQRSKLVPAPAIAEMEKEGISYFKFAMNKSIEHQTHFQESLLSQDIVEMFESISSKSFDDQRAIEAKDGVSFEQYLRNLQNSYSDLL